MNVLAAILIAIVILGAVVYGRALVYGYSDEYEMDLRIKDVIGK
jgi:hypothetical protein